MKGKRIKECILKGLIYLSAFITFGITLWIILHIFYKGIFNNGIFKTIDFKIILSSIGNTFFLVFLSIIISAPIGISSAIYLNEYAKDSKIVDFIRFAIQSLSGIPSIIFGLFGMIVFVIGLNFKWSILSGAFTLGLMILPIIITTTEEALKSVPDTFREGSYALGASKFETIMKVVLPSALSGIFISIVLAIGRIVGETAAIYLTAGMVPRLANSILDSGRTLSVHLYILAKEGISFEEAYLTASILIVFILIINILTNKLAKKLDNKLNID
ncbi:MAG TPA: phosphate ABC transporter permease PstA [Tissierellales bacterium]|nr:phosphate ABC transporter permease PstA [Tissierellales bacterium]